MRRSPSRIAEVIVALLLPPACREEVLGDLHQRYRSRLRYFGDVLSTVPLVILSRIRRTADAQIVLIQAFAVYMSFLGAAWFRDSSFVREEWALVRLAVPVAMILAGLVLDDAWAMPGNLSRWSLVRGPILGALLALVSQELLWSPVPRWIVLYGCATSLLLSSAVRILFPPMTNQLLGVNAPATWLKQTGMSVAGRVGILLVLVVLLVVHQILVRR